MPLVLLASRVLRLVPHLSRTQPVTQTRVQFYYLLIHSSTHLTLTTGWIVSRFCGGWCWDGGWGAVSLLPLSSTGSSSFVVHRRSDRFVLIPSRPAAHPPFCSATHSCCIISLGYSQSVRWLVPTSSLTVEAHPLPATFWNKPLHPYSLIPTWWYSQSHPSILDLPW